MKALLGQAAVGEAQLRVADGVEAEAPRQLVAERRRQRRDVVQRAGRAAPHRIGDLAAPVRRVAAVREPRRQLSRGQAGQPRTRIARDDGQGETGGSCAHHGSLRGLDGGIGRLDWRAGAVIARGPDRAAQDRRTATQERLTAHRPAARRLDLVEHEPPVNGR